MRYNPQNYNFCREYMYMFKRDVNKVQIYNM